ncbi:nitroreductase family protein [Vibrio breoganii]
MRTFLKRFYFLVVLKRVLRTLLECSFNFFHDCMMYVRHSASIYQENDKVKLEGRICVLYHAVEKGLSLRESQQGFGKEKITKLLELTKKYRALDGDEELLVTCKNVLLAYCAGQKENIDASLLNKIESSELLNMEFNEVASGGVESLKANQLDFNQYRNFALTRKSVRNFTQEEIEYSDLEDVIEVSRYTPSVCNRQPWNSYIYTDSSEILKALSYQNGNRGFGEQVKGLIVVTGERKKFWHAIERNQVYVDGGMFSMSIVYALHAKNLSSCCLNLNMSARKEEKLKRYLNIPKSEALVMMIAVGKAATDAKVAVSSRFSTNKFIGNK